MLPLQYDTSTAVMQHAGMRMQKDGMHGDGTFYLCHVRFYTRYRILRAKVSTP
jgi:hypothetical protein